MITYLYIIPVYKHTFKFSLVYRVYCYRSWMLKYAEDFKHNPSLRDKVSELKLAVEQEGEEEMLAIVDLDQ